MTGQAATLAGGGGRLLSSNRKGFTLAEVLVTLGIIGVVSAMTVPSLMQNYQRQSYVTQLHKVYNEIQQASLKYMNDKNAINLREAGLTTSAEMKIFLKDYFKVINDCETYVKEPCFAASYKSINGTSYYTGGEWGAGASVLLASGAGILLDRPSQYQITVGDVTSYHGHMLIDINGPKGPNIAGRDLFYAEFYDDGSIDVLGATPECKSKGICSEDSSLDDIRNDLFNKNCFSSGYAKGCIGKIINDGWQMNY